MKAAGSDEDCAKWLLGLHQEFFRRESRIEPYFNNRLILKIEPAPDFEVYVSRKYVREFRNWLYLLYFQGIYSRLPQILPIRPKQVAISNFHPFNSSTNINLN